MKKIRVVELFAGVGGFRLGLEGVKGKKKHYHKNFETIWFNQWEPGTKKQHAHEVYTSRFGNVDEYTNIDIAKVVNKVPNHDLLVGGFPCQDYSVARNLSSAKGLEGKKGVLWWSIYNILKTKGKNSPNYLMLENVDRLLKSPAKQRGRDFAIILSTLNELGYFVEWKVINAADYGFPQRRRRIFIMGYKKGSSVYKKIKKIKSLDSWMKKDGLISKAFPFDLVSEIKKGNIDKDPVVISNDKKSYVSKKSIFEDYGIAFDYNFYTVKTKANYKGTFTVLNDILLEDNLIPNDFYIDKDDLKKWKYLKGAKNEPRKSASGFEFTYTEGAMIFPDQKDKPSRTIVTGEGGKTPSRFKHVVETKNGLRRLTPIELERLCMFPDNHTAGQPDVKRAFFMGNALVVGVIDRLGEVLSNFHFSKK